METPDNTPVSLSHEEARVLGCLIEKEKLTPDHYPLTLNSLVAACNQKTSRDPVVDYEEETVKLALDALFPKKLAYRVDQAGSRTAKFRHNAKTLLELTDNELATVGILLLRGAQTLGEIRTRTERMAHMSLEACAETLESLEKHPEGALVRMLPRQPGQKEARYAQLLTGAPAPEEHPEHGGAAGSIPSAAPSQPDGASIIDVRIREAVERETRELREKVDGLNGTVEALRQELREFKAQF